MAVNPTKLTWTNPTTRVDGTPYNGASENAGYELSINGAPAVAIPLAWGTEFDLASLNLKSGSYSVTLAVVSKSGVKSAPSAPATFQIEAPPNAPTNLAAV